MLFKQNNCQTVQGILLTSLLTLLASCGDTAALEDLIRADPKLKEGKTEQPSSQINSQLPPNSSSPQSQDSLSATPQLKEEPADGKEVNTIASENKKTGKNNPSNQPAAEAKVEDQLVNFPESFPVYPQAELQEIKTDEAKKSGILIWNTTDNRQAVADYYQAELLVNDWEIIKPFTISPQQKIARAIAIKDQLRIELTLLPSATKQESESQNTQLSLAYRPVSQDGSSSISQAIESAETTQPLETETKPSNQKADLENSEQPQKIPDKFQPELTEPESVSASGADNSYFDSSDNDFDDLDKAPEQLKQPLESVAALSILTPYTAKANVELTKFAPNKVITRGEYARWLIAANNRYYSDNPGKKIYVAAKTNQSAFKDVKSDHPDFEAIQSLAEAGLIPSRLTEDSTNLLFRPDAPLIREDLVTWKVPLDMRKSLPKASIKAIEESWGFQDAADIDSSAIRALYADFQNGDRSNIRRIFGYTMIFQPKKSVTRAEAAASLWYFGFQGDGITAKELLESETETDN
ncbi:MAG: S-layer homology domain-containing protein [Waterburya sp.]